MDDPIVVIGGGVVGMSTADSLARRRNGGRVVVLEPDIARSTSSTLRSDGNVRIQFNLDLNIACSIFSRTFYDTLLDGVELPPRRGNLFLVNEPGRAAAESGLAAQRRQGERVDWLDTDEIAQRWPFLRTTGAVVGGTWGPDDGAVDPNLVIRALRDRCRDRGVEERATAATAILPHDAGGWTVQTADGSIPARQVVVAAGAWSAALLRPLDIDLPVVPVARTVYVVRTQEPPPADTPGVFLPNGTYGLVEPSGTFLVARSLPDDPQTTDLVPRPVSHFEDRIWPIIGSTLPSFAALRVQGSWCGLYAQNTLDGNAIVGEWPDRPGLWMATGFSGHGYQHGPAIGRALADGLTGSSPSLDVSDYSPVRLGTGRRLDEHAGRLI